MAVLSRLLPTSLTNRTSNQNPNLKKGAIGELALLLIIWGILGLLYVLADYSHATKAQRYQLEYISSTPNVTKSTLLAQVCGQDFLAKVASHRTDNNYHPSQDCPSVANGQGLTLANDQLNKIQQALATSWQQQKSQDRRIDMVRNETNIELGDTGLSSRQDWLDLNANGQLDSIGQLQAQVQNLTKTATTPEAKANLTIAMLAVADGNKRFGFNRMYAEQPEFAKLLNQATADVAGVYEANQNQTRAEQANQLLPLFGNVKHLGLMTQVCIWSLATWLVLMLSRQHRHPLLMIPIAMTVWGLVIALVSHEVILPMKVGLGLFCVGVLLTAVSLFLPMPRLQQHLPDNREQMTSIWLFPLFVGFTTFGLMILLDLSSRSYLSLRYLFLAHFKDLFWGYVLVSLSRVWAMLISGVLKWLVANNLLHALWGKRGTKRKKRLAGRMGMNLSGKLGNAKTLTDSVAEALDSESSIKETTLANEPLASQIQAEAKSAVPENLVSEKVTETKTKTKTLENDTQPATQVNAVRQTADDATSQKTSLATKKAYIWLGVMALGYLGLSVLLRGDSAKVAELGKMWLIVFLAIFLAINQRALINNLFFKSKKMTLLLLFSVLMPVLALGIANEKGTILVMMFVFTFLVGVALSNRIFQMGGRGYILGVLSSTAILLALMMVLVNLSGFDDRTAERVSTWIDPFASTNDQMAILHWFRESTPILGFGFGDIPWCGYHLSGCRGVPLQMQSDYTITSVMAVTGMGVGVVFIGLYMLWLLIMANNQLAFAGEQMKSRLLSGGYQLLAWVILVWVIVTIFQAIVTISGNLGMLPLTGVTLPFVSYGTSSLWFNCVMLSLALFQPKVLVGR